MHVENLGWLGNHTCVQYVYHVPIEFSVLVFLKEIEGKIICLQVLIFLFSCPESTCQAQYKMNFI